METDLLDSARSLYGNALVGSVALAALWEWGGACRSPAGALRVRWAHNFALWLAGASLTRLVLPVVSVGVALAAAGGEWGLLHLLDAPVWIAVPAGVLALDLASYLHHRLLHAVPGLWRFHRVHHSDRDFDFTVGFRFHPLEALTTATTGFVAIALVGVSPLAVVVHEVLAGVGTVLQHANARLPRGLDAVVRGVLVTPDVHRVHHSARVEETDTNFGTVLTWWDRLLGTYRDQPAEGHEGMRIGLEDTREPSRLRLVWLLAHPLLPSTLERRLFHGRDSAAVAG